MKQSHLTETTRRYALGVLIGRYSPFHNGHMAVINRASQMCDNLLIILGSANASRRPDHIPFTVDERKEMIIGALDADLTQRVRCVGVEDSDSMVDWISAVQSEAANALLYFNSTTVSVALVGHAKDGSSFYLKAFPEWESIEVENCRGLSATPMRQSFFAEDCEPAVVRSYEVPIAVQDWLIDFMSTPSYREMVLEWAHIVKTKSAWDSAPYAPIFVTVDAVVIQSGYVLMVERGGRPGKGQMALPGGFIDQLERAEDGIFRELIEETKIKVPMKVLKRSLVATRYFDDPYRSSRGRTITFAGLIYLEPEAPAGITDKKKIAAAFDLPRVKGSDDAKKAFWIPISSLKRSECFEDHYSIIMTMKALLKENI